MLLYRASTPYIASLGRVPGSEQYGDVRRHPQNRTPDGVAIPFIDVTGARMLDGLAGDLRRRGVELLIARDVGQVRDLLGHEAADPALYPSVQAAGDAAIKSVAA